MTVSQWIFIEPNDVWLFRDNKPFSAQQNFVARGQFPPNPQVMQGAVRTHAYHDNPQHPIVTDAQMDNLLLEGPYLAKRHEDGKSYTRYFPTPMDLLFKEDTDTDKAKNKNKGKDEDDEGVVEGSFYTLEVGVPQSDILTDLPTGWRLLHNPAENLKASEGWLDEAQLRAYLQGTLKVGTLTRQSGIAQREERVGIGLDYTRKANRDGMFYHAQFIRLQEGFGLLLSTVYKDKLFAQEGMIRVGGESRFGHYALAPTPDSLWINQAKRTRLKVVLLTPAYFEDGWQPAGGAWSGWVGDGVLVSAVIGKPEAISGWDIAKNEPKPLRHFVPAGSVYYFENATWQGTPFSQSVAGMPFSQMGFGTVALGTW